MTPHSPTLFCVSWEVLEALHKTTLRLTTYGRPCAQSGYRATETGRGAKRAVAERKHAASNGERRELKRWRDDGGAAHYSRYLLRKERCNYSLSTSFKSTFFNAAKPTSERGRKPVMLPKLITVDRGWILVNFKEEVDR